MITPSPTPTPTPTPTPSPSATVQAVAQSVSLDADQFAAFAVIAALVVGLLALIAVGMFRRG